MTEMIRIRRLPQSTRLAEMGSGRFQVLPSPPHAGVVVQGPWWGQQQHHELRGSQEWGIAAARHLPCGWCCSSSKACGIEHRAPVLP